MTDHPAEKSKLQHWKINCPEPSFDGEWVLAADARELEEHIAELEKKLQVFADANSLHVATIARLETELCPYKQERNDG